MTMSIRERNEVRRLMRESLIVVAEQLRRHEGCIDDECAMTDEVFFGALAPAVASLCALVDALNESASVDAHAKSLTIARGFAETLLQVLKGFEASGVRVATIKMIEELTSDGNN